MIICLWILIVIYEALSLSPTLSEALQALIWLIPIHSMWDKDYESPHFLVYRSKSLIQDDNK